MKEKLIEHFKAPKNNFKFKFLAQILKNFPNNSMIMLK